MPLFIPNIPSSAPVTSASSSIYINVTTYGAKGDGVTDDTAAFLKAILAASTGDTIFIPGGIPGTTNIGVYLISSSLVISNNGSHLLGAGKEATILKKTGNFDLIDLSGSATGDANHRKHCSVRNMTLHGNNKTGKLIKVYYSSLHYFESIHFYGCNDMAVESVEFWDSYFQDCYWDFCGDQAGINPGVYLKNAATPSGFGFSADSTNMIWFVNCHWESFYAGALWVDALNGSLDNPTGIFLVNCKMESTLIMGPFLKFGSLCRIVSVENLYISADAFNSGFSTPVDAIDFSGGGNFHNIWIQNGGSLLSSGIKFNPSDISTLSGVKMSGTNPTTAVVNFAGGNGTIVHFDGIQGNGTLYANNTSGGGNIYAFDSNPQRIHNPSFASTYTPDPLAKGNVVIISPVTGAMTINGPTVRWPGAELDFLLTSNATGNFALTWDSSFKATTNYAIPTTMPGANATLFARFKSDGTNWYRMS